ncbi:MAG TPA: hypothetical protein VMN37_03075 [Gemmatimonadales bacterium]|nr:hypothetical protein [Gemmatimonadales bacterium]
MKTAIALGMSSLMLLTAFSMNTRPMADARPAFSAEIAGEISARPTGEARFGVTPGAEGAPAVFTISLGADAEEGSVLFTRRSGVRLSPGTYTVSDRADGTDDIRALVMTGSATRPTGVFQGQSGSLVVASASDHEIRGTFRVEARGFLAARPDAEDRPVTVAGSFSASH